LNSKLLKLSLAVVIVAVALAAFAMTDADEGDAGVGDEFTVGNLTYTVLDSDHVSVKMKSLSETYGSVTIPSNVSDGSKNYTVTKIADNGFKDNTKILSVTFPDTVTEIGDHAFDGCTSLKVVSDYATKYVPSEYKVVEYIRSSGSQYIITEWTPDLTKDLIVEGKAGFATSSRGMLVSSYSSDGGSGNNISVELYNNSTLRTYVTDDVGSNLLTGMSVGNVADFRIEYTASNGLLSKTMNGQSNSGTVPGAGRVLNTLPAVLGSDQDKRFQYAILGEIHVVNGDYSADFIPCIRQSDSVVGMYEVVSGKFFVSSGTGMFSAGPVSTSDLTSIPTISLSNVKVIGDYAFLGVSEVEFVYLPEVTSIGSYAFSGFTSVEAITGTYEEITQSPAAGYVQLSYIQSTGAQYIDTEILPVSTDDISIKFRKVSASNSTEMFFGSMPSSTKTIPRYSLGCSGGKFVGGWNSTADMGAVNTDVHVMHAYASGGKYYVALDGNAVVCTTETAEESALTAYLFARHGTAGVQVTDGNGTAIYYIDWKDSSGSQKFYGIPCKRLSDGEVGIYDTVSGEFYVNSGIGSFIEGSSVMAKAIYVPKLTSVGDYAFSGCTSLASAKLDKVTLTGSHLFDGCTKLMFMGLDSLVDVGAGTFMGSGIEEVSTDENYKSSVYHPTGSGSGLPMGYTKLEYIESTGSQYLSVPNYRHIVMDVVMTSTTMGWTGMNSDLQLTIGIGSGCRDSTGYTFTLAGGTHYVISQDKSSKLTGLRVDGKLIQSYGSQSGGASMIMKMDGGSFQGVLAKWYAVSIYDSSDALIGSLVPCKRNSDSVIGMYDTLNGTFYVNKGSGTFVEGPVSTNLPERVTAYLPLAKTIGDSAFEGCTALTNADLENVTDIGVKAFKGCTGITSVSNDKTTSRLPKGYTEVEYIQSSGTQYILTDLIPSDANYRFEGAWSREGNVSFYNAVFDCCSNNGTNDNWRLSYAVSSTSKLAINTYSTSATNFNVDLTSGDTGVKHTFDIYRTGNTAHVIIDGKESTFSTSQSSVAPQKLNILRQGYNGDCLSAKLWELKVYHNGDLCNDYVPCVCSSDDSVGLYDVVEGKFYGNSGNGKFTSGPAVAPAAADVLYAPSLQTIGGYAFEGATGLLEVTLPGLKTIGDNAFDGCTSLETVSTPSVTSIGDYAFRGCIALADADFENAVSLGDGAFSGCTAFQSVGEETSVLPKGYVQLQYIESSGTQYIDTEFVFSENKGKIESKSQVSSIGSSFAQKRLSGSYSGSSSNSRSLIHYYASGDKFIYIGAGTTDHKTTIPCANDQLVESTVTANGGSLTVSASVNGTSYNWSGSYSGTIVTTGKSHYLFCNNETGTAGNFGSFKLFYYRIYDGDTLARDFVPCVRSSDSVVGLYDLVDGKFYPNSGKGNFTAGPTEKVRSDIYMGSLQTMGSSAFENCTGLETVELSKLTTINGSAFGGCTSLYSLSMSSLTSISESAFKDCTTIQSVTMSSLKTIPKYAFSGCTGLVDADFEKVTSIGEGAFSGCTAFQSVGEDTSLLPKGYTQVEYITSNGTGYIQLNYGFYKTDEVEIKTKWGFTGAEHYLATEATWDSNNRFAIGGGYENGRSIGYGNKSTNDTPYSPKVNSSQVIVAVETYKDYLFTITADGINSTYNASSVGFTNETSKIRLFWGWNSEAAGTIYYWKHIKGGVLVEDLIPCINPNGEVGMYDLVSGTFFGSNKPSAMTAGPVTHTRSDVYMASLQTVDNSAFAGCTGLKTFDSSTLVSVGASAFSGCTSLDSVTASKLKSVGESAFSGCTALTNVELSEDDSCTLGNGAFVNAGKASDGLSMTAKIYSLGTGVFSGANIASINGDAGKIVMNNVSAIPDETFMGMTGATSFTANNVNSVKDKAFKGSSIATVSIPSCYTIGTYVFADCGYLTEVTVSSTATTVGSFAFNNAGQSTTDGTTIYGKMDTISESAFEDSKLKGVNPDSSYAFNFNGTKRIYLSAFEGSNVTTVNLPDLEGLDRGTFSDCKDLTSVNIGTKFTDQIAITAFSGCTALKTFVAKGVTSIGDSAFKSCKKLETVTLGDCKSVGISAFEGCSSLEASAIAGKIKSISDRAFMGTATAKLESTVAGQTIGEYAFADCESLKTIDSKAVSVGAYAFYISGGTSSLETVVLNEMTSMGSHAFSECRQLLSVSADKLKVVPAYAFNECSNLRTMSLKSVTTIGNYAFSECGIEKINSEGYVADMPLVTSIGTRAFESSKFGTVIVGSVTKIDTAAFYRSSSLSTVKAVCIKEIGNEAFSGCSLLTVITDNVSDSTNDADWKTDRSYLTKTNRVGTDAFNGTRISDLATGDITSLAEGAFRGMTHLTDVIIQGEIQTLPENTFNGCSALETVYLCEDIKSIGIGSFAGTSDVIVYSSSENIAGDLGTATLITYTTTGISYGYVTTAAGDNTTKRRVITGTKFTLPYTEDGSSIEMALILTVGSGSAEKKYQLLAGRSGDVVNAYPEINSEMIFGQKIEGDVGFHIEATFEPETVFGTETHKWDVTKYGQTIMLPVPLDGIVIDAKFTHYFGNSSNKTFKDPDGNETIQSPIPVTVCFYEDEFELKSSQAKYKITLNYNSSVDTGVPNTTTEYDAGKNLVLPALPNVNGYVAMGWYYDALGINPVGPYIIVSKNMTLYAYYTPKSVSVSIILAGEELAKIESKQFVQLTVYNRGDPDNGGWLIAKGPGGITQKVTYYDSEKDDHFDPKKYGDINGYDFNYYTVNSAKYADSSSAGYTEVPILYEDAVVEVFYSERSYDIKLQYFDRNNNPLDIQVQIDGVSPIGGYWKKGLNFNQVSNGVVFPIQKVSTTGWTFYSAATYASDGSSETKIGPDYGMEKGLTSTDITVNLDTFYNQSLVIIKLYFEAGKYVLRFDTTDCSETLKVPNSAALAKTVDIRPYLISVGGTGTHGYTFEGWMFNGTMVTDQLDPATGYLTQAMVDYGDAHSMFIDLEAKWTVNKYAVKFVITDESGQNGEEHYSTTYVQINDPFPEKYTDGTFEYNVSDVSKDYYDLVGWRYSSIQPPIEKLATATVLMDYLYYAKTAEKPIIGGVQTDGTLVLTTVWTDKTYTIEFDPACTTDIKFPSVKAIIGDPFQIPDASVLSYSIHKLGDPEWFVVGYETKTFNSNEYTVLTKDIVDHCEGNVVTIKAFWIFDSYYIAYTFKEQDVTGNVPEAPTYAFQVDSPITIASAKDEHGEYYLQRTGYVLLGWNYKEGASYATPTSTMMTADMARTSDGDHIVYFYPVWGAQTYSIKYELAGGMQGAYTPTSGTFGEDVTISSPTYYGHDFTGWTATGINETYAQFKAGTSYASWNGSLTRATIFNSLTDSVDTPVVMTANWVEAEYVIRYDANGGLGAAYGGDLKAVNGQMITLAKDRNDSGEVVLSKEGYTFSGWSVDGVSLIGKGGEQIKFTDRISTYTDDKGQVVIYAVWTYNSYEIQYKVTENASIVKTSAFYDLPVTIGQPERNGYVFAGWKITEITGGTFSINARYSSDGIVWMPWSELSSAVIGSYVMNLTTNPGAVVSIVGMWEEQEYTLVYHANGGVGTLPEETTGCKVGYSFTLPQTPSLSKNGYAFIGWSFDKVNLITKTEFTLAMAELADKNHRITVYAMWSAGTYTTNVDEGQGSSISILAYYDSPSSIGIPERPGYTFVGWSSGDINTQSALYSRDGESWFNWTSTSDVIYAGFFKNLGDNGTTVSMTAQWNLIDYTIKYSPNGGVGEVPEDTNIYHVDDPITLPAVKDVKLSNGEKILVGWSLERESLYAQEISKFEEYMTSYANSSNIVTIYAVWSERSYTVTVDIGDSVPSSVPIGWSTGQTPGTYTKQVEYGTPVEDVMESWSGVVLSKDGYKFDTWSFSHSKIVTDVTVTAVFKKVSQSTLFILVGIVALAAVCLFVYTRFERR